MINSKTSIWYEVSVSYSKALDDGSEERVKEQYIVEAQSFTEAEVTIVDRMQRGAEVDINGIKKANFSEIFFGDFEEAKLYRVKMSFLTYDEKSSREKKIQTNYIVQSDSVEGVMKAITKMMGQSVSNYEIVNITETKFKDVIEYKNNG